MKHRIATLSLLVATLFVNASAFAQKAGEPITLNFANAEIEAVARTIATITNRNVVVDPRVKGTINLQTDKPVSPAVAYNQFLATIRLLGFTVVEAGGLYKVVPEADAKLQSGAVSAGPVVPGGNQIVTQIFKLNYETANNLVPVLRPLISPNNTISVNPGNNSLVITDYADNLQRISKIISTLDVSNATDLEIVPLRNSVAADLIPILNRLIETTAAGGATATPGQADTSFKTALLAEPRSNAIIIRAANPARVAQIRSLIARLDQPALDGPNGAAGNIYVVYLKNADAVKLATTLRAAMSGDARGGSSSGGATGGSSGSSSSGLTPASSNTSSSASSLSSASAGTGSTIGSTASSNQPSTGGQIQADPSTNSLIITAPEPQYRQIRAVIDKLDSRRAQVLVESLIVEVNSDKAAEFGVQWQGLLGKNGNSNIGILGSNFSVGGTTNIIDAATAAAAGSINVGTGLNVGVAHRTDGVYILGFLARFFQSSGEANVLSTPTLLTLDNEEAKIVVGQNVPFVTGQYTNNNTSNGSVNPFQTVERKDVGLTLRVKPQISENGTVKMTIFQEVSSIAPGSTTANGLITNKRSIESNVLVDDGSVVVLGGLLSDEYGNTEEKIPGVGDVPFFGNLFKSQARSRAKKNLMVFLRPVIVRDAAAADSLSLDRYDVMRTLQQGAQPEPNKLLDSIKTSPVIPEAPFAPKRPIIPGPGTGTTSPSLAQ